MPQRITLRREDVDGDEPLRLDLAARVHASHGRLARYDGTGLMWLLQGRSVVAFTESTAAIENLAANITVYYKTNKPALGPPGDSLDDFH